ncbi:hypothetical protein M2397_002226 [Pseudomonas sp. BIGb0381]|nr:hypothetical protein [Pseudomonas sp. SJZ073]MBB6312498.1 hypothetical protein [Pseudomonas sp. JAI120]MCS4311931.1 hypothetical protein [Pseudomonas sp. BIGb0381]
MAIAGAGAAAVAVPIISTVAPMAIDLGIKTLGMAINTGSSLAKSMTDAQKDNPNQVPAG